VIVRLASWWGARYFGKGGLHNVSSARWVAGKYTFSALEREGGGQKVDSTAGRQPRGGLEKEALYGYSVTTNREKGSLPRGRL